MSAEVVTPGADMVEVSLIGIGRDGIPKGFQGELEEIAGDVLRGTVALYESVGYEEPWVGYLCIVDSCLVGTCGFKSAPAEGRVEIAYFTFPRFEGRGIASAMASELVDIAQRERPGVVVVAQTLPRASASTRILQKLDFRHVSTLEHPEDGEVWEWQLRPKTGT